VILSARLASNLRRYFDGKPVRGVLVDAGPLVALLDKGDAEHEVCVTTLKEIRESLITVWPAFTEAMYLLGGSWSGQKALWSRLETQALTLAALDERDAPRMRELMEKYRDLPMDLADAALVRVAERESCSEIFTLDRKHFSIYRPGRRRRFSIVPD
jgi:predicted nucleic acid-binding protein